MEMLDPGNDPQNQGSSERVSNGGPPSNGGPSNNMEEISYAQSGSGNGSNRKCNPAILNKTTSRRGKELIKSLVHRYRDIKNHEKNIETFD